MCLHLKLLPKGLSSHYSCQQLSWELCKAQEATPNENFPPPSPPPPAQEGMLPDVNGKPNCCFVSSWSRLPGTFLSPFQSREQIYGVYQSRIPYLKSLLFSLRKLLHNEMICDSAPFDFHFQSVLKVLVIGQIKVVRSCQLKRDLPLADA